MKRITPRPLHTGGIHSLASLAVLCLAACSPGDVVEIEQARQTRGLPTMLPLGASGAERFGDPTGMMGGPTDSQTSPENPFRWIVPEGWQELASSQMRLINLRPAGNAEAECYLTVLGSVGNQLTDNVNRWRGQIGQPPIGEQEVEMLSRISLLGQGATVVDLRGTYDGMGGEGRENWGLLGAIVSRDQFTITVKMTGPADLVTAERPNFERFVTTLSTSFENDDPHAGHNHAPGEGHGEESSPVTDDLGTNDNFDYSLPDGWREGPEKMVRSVNLLVGAGTQCYVIVLPGESGGLELNVNRWLGEVQNDSLGAIEIEALPKVEALGQQVPLVEGFGDYQGMGGPEGESMILLGVPIIRSTTSIFIKMVGPEEEVAAEREHFLKFVASLEEKR